MAHKKQETGVPGAEGGPSPTVAPGTARRRGGRWSARRKVEMVLRLLRGESLDLVAREVGVTAHTLASWKEAFLGSGEAGLKSRKGDPLFEENSRLKSKVGELTMEVELLYEKIHRMEAGLHPTPRRLRK